MPTDPFKVRDPYYYGFWWWIFLGLSDVSDGGSCHGFAAASQLYANGMIPLAKFDRGPSGAPARRHWLRYLVITIVVAAIVFGNHHRGF